MVTPTLSPRSSGLVHPHQQPLAGSLSVCEPAGCAGHRHRTCGLLQTLEKTWSVAFLTFLVAESLCQALPSLWEPVSEGTGCFLLGRQVGGGTSLYMSHKGGHGGTLTASKTHRHTVSHPHHTQRCVQTHDRTLGPERRHRQRDNYSQTQCTSESFMLERPSVAEEHARKTPGRQHSVRPELC